MRNTSKVLCFTVLLTVLMSFGSAVRQAQAATNVIQTVNVNVGQCNGSLLSGTNPNGNLCWSGTGSSNYSPFSLAAMQAGIQTFPQPLNGSSTLVVLNDTGSTTVSLQLAGTIAQSVPITCQGSNGSTGCSVSGPLGTFGDASTAANPVLYGPGSSSSSWPAKVMLTFYGVPLNGVVGLQWSQWNSAGQLGVVLGGTVPQYGNPAASCSAGGTTTITGKVYSPNGIDPLPGVLVYIPSSAPGALSQTVSCITDANQALGSPVTSALSGIDGSFTLRNVPPGTNIPLVVQTGKWRVQRVISTVASCGSTSVAANLTTLPATRFAGDIPSIALVTGNRSSLECVLTKTGVDKTEFTNPAGLGRIQLYAGAGAAGVTLDINTPSEATLVSSPSTLNNYDMILLPDQGVLDPQATTSNVANVLAWANSGGRILAEHSSYVWLNNSLNAAPHDVSQGPQTAVAWAPGQQSPTPVPGLATINASLPDASNLANWLQQGVIGATSTLGQIALSNIFLDQNGVVPPTQSLLSLNLNATLGEIAHPVMQLAFNTPVGSIGNAQCGRVLFNDYVAEYAALGLAGQTFPSECSPVSTAQDRLAEYALFDLAKGVIPVTAATVSQSYVNAPATFLQGASNNQIAITIANTSTIAVDSSLKLTGTLPSGTMVNKSSFWSGVWFCASGSGNVTFSCTRSAALDAQSQDTIYVPVAVAANASVGTSGSLTTTISGGGLAVPVVGSNTLTVGGVVNVACPTTNTVQVGTVFNSGAITATGGVGPYTFSVLGILPAGLTLNSSTGAVTGTATAFGNFTIQARDTNGVTGTACGVMVTAAPTATSNSLGVAIAYNLVALSGDVVDGADITGRIAASGQVTQPAVNPPDQANTTVGSDLRISDPYFHLSAQNGGPYAVVAAGGIPNNAAFNLNGGGNVYSSTPTTANLTFVNEYYPGSFYMPSQLVTGGVSPIDFIALKAQIIDLSGKVAALAQTGVVCTLDNFGAVIPGNGCPSNPVVYNPTSPHYNSNWLLLYGTSATVNVFNITQAQFEGNNSLDIEVPTGSTTIINVAGTGITLHTSPFYQGKVVTDANAHNIVFNFPTATTLNIDAQIDGLIVAPLAALSGGSQMGGIFIASSIGPTGEVHYIPFDGTLPITSTPPSTLSVTCASVTVGEVGVAFNSGTTTVSGGTGPYTYSIIGSLPLGLTLNASTGVITGTPIASGSFILKVTDSLGQVATMTCPITINAVIGLTCASTTMGEVGVLLNTAVTASGGVGPYTYAVATGTLPAGLTLNALTGVLIGTPTASGSFSLKVTDSLGQIATTTCPISINAGISLACASATAGEIGTLFSSTLTASGGVGPFIYAVATGALPAGLTLNASTGLLTGTPTASGSFTVKVTDSLGQIAIATCPININARIGLACASTALGEVGALFNSSVTASGGVGPYTYAVATGSLPVGLTLNASTGVLTGTPTTSGNFSLKVTDGLGQIATTTCPITINAGIGLACASNTLGEVGVLFNTALAASGGVGPFTYSVATGALPSGLTLNASTGAITGTPTASGTFTLKATDSLGQVAIATCPININAGVSLACASTTLGEVGALFSSNLTASAGVGPYIYAVATGSLPAGLTLNASTGAITGTPTASGSFTLKATDSLGQVAIATCPININAGISLVCASTTLGEVGALFNASVTASGGVGAYTYAVATGSLPAGLTLNASTGLISGTPTASGTFTIKATDALGQIATTTCPISINAGVSLTAASSLVGEIGLPFSSSIAASGGVGPYTYAVATGTLPAGLTLNASTGAITGTPTGFGSFTIKVTDSLGQIATTSSPITINTAISLACASTTLGEIGALLNTSVTASGGVGPYTYAVATGTLPAGLTLNASTGLITGTPTASGTFTIKATDILGQVATTTCPITINAGISLACASTTLGEIGALFNTNVTASGGVGAYTYAVASGVLPAGLTLNASTGVITGTPTASGSFTIKATDSLGQVATTTCPININAGVSLTCASNTAGLIGSLFSTSVAASGGVGPYTYAVSTGTLPLGLTLNASTGAITGTPTASGSFSLKVTDSLGQVATASCPITINTPLTVTCPLITVGQVGTAFNSGGMIVLGGTAPYTYSIVGTLPAGLTLSATTGAVSGTPTSAGSFSIKVSDANGTSGTTCPITIKANQAISFSLATPVTYGVGPITLSATGGASGNPVVFSVISGPGTLSGTNNGVLTVTGAGTIVVAANQAGNTGYNAAMQVTQSLLVNKATPVITWPTPAAVNAGTLLTGTQLNATANVPGIFAYNPGLLSPLLVVGAQVLSATFVPTDVLNYSSVTATVTINVNAITLIQTGNYTLTASPNELTLAGGQSGSIVLTMTPTGGYTGSVTFSCPALPLYIQCQFSPTTLTANGTNRAVTSTLTITANQLASIDPPGQQGSKIVSAGIWFLPAMLGGLLLCVKRRNLQVWMKYLAIAVVACNMAVLMTGCATGSGQSIVGTSTVTLQATSTASATNGATTTSTGVFKLNIVK